MRSINKVILIGNVTRDPQTKTSGNGQQITTLGIATNRQWRTVNGEKRTSAEFHELVAWARLAEVCSKMVKRGMPVYVEGYLKTRSWENEAGEKFRKTEIVIQDIIILEKPDRSQSNFTPSENKVTEEISESRPKPEVKKVATSIAPKPPKPEPAIELEGDLVSDLKEIDIDDDLGL